MAQKNCEECGVLFNYNPPANFPDRRKYCDNCSAAKKAAYEASKQAPAQPAQQAVPAPTKQVTSMESDLLRLILAEMKEIKEEIRNGKEEAKQ